jgi:hypothetical protein
MHGNAKQTGGGLKMKDLKYNKHGKIVSKKVSSRAKKEKRLQKAGFKTRKGVFELFRKQYGGSNAIAPPPSHVPPRPPSHATRQPTFRPINTTPPSHLTQPALLFPMVEGYTPEEILRNRDTIIQLFFGGLYIKAVQKYRTGKGKELQVHRWNISDFNDAMRLLKTKNTDMERIIGAGIDKLMKRTLDIYETPAQLDVIIDTAMKSAQRQFDGTSGVTAIVTKRIASLAPGHAKPTRQNSSSYQAYIDQENLTPGEIQRLIMKREMNNDTYDTNNTHITQDTKYIKKKQEIRARLAGVIQSLRSNGERKNNKKITNATQKLVDFNNSAFKTVMNELAISNGNVHMDVIGRPYQQSIHRVNMHGRNLGKRPHPHPNVVPDDGTFTGENPMNLAAHKNMSSAVGIDLSGEKPQNGHNDFAHTNQ